MAVSWTATLAQLVYDYLKMPHLLVLPFVQTCFQIIKNFQKGLGLNVQPVDATWFTFIHKSGEKFPSLGLIKCTCPFGDWGSAVGKFNEASAMKSLYLQRPLAARFPSSVDTGPEKELFHVSAIFCDKSLCFYYCRQLNVLTNNPASFSIKFLFGSFFM